MRSLVRVLGSMCLYSPEGGMEDYWLCSKGWIFPVPEAGGSGLDLYVYSLLSSRDPSMNPERETGARGADRPVEARAGHPELTVPPSCRSVLNSWDLQWDFLQTQGHYGSCAQTNEVT